MAESDDLLAECHKEFERCRDGMRENHLTGLDDLKFSRLSDQWPAEIRKQRDIDGRPCLTINKLPSFIRQVVNDARQNKPQVSVHPVDSNADPETAEVLGDIIRNIETVSNADVAYDTAADQSVSSGFGYWRINIDYAYADAFELDIRIDRVINQFAVYGDPNSTAVDSSDWDIAFITDAIPKDEYRRKYKGKAEVDFDGGAWGTCRGSPWQTDDTVLIAERWKREEVDKEIVLLSDGRVFGAEELAENPDLQIGLEDGSITVVKTRTIKHKKVTQTILSGAEVLEEPKEFPGCYIPIVPVYGDEIIVEGKRYFRSLIHNAKDAQMMFNYWRTTATELVALTPRVPWVGPVGFAAEDPNWATANTRSHAYLEYSGGIPPQRQALDTGVAGGALQEALNSSDDMKAIIGIYDASLGARSNETSGRAIMARQREGDVSTFHFIDNLTRAIRHTGRILIELIPHVYTGARIMRLIGEDGKPYSKPVNQPYDVMDENGQPVMEEATDEMGRPVMDEQGQKVMRVVRAMHDISIGKYDVTVKAGPSFTSRREEAATQMTELIRAYPQAAPVIADKMAENFDWPGAGEIAERFAAMNPQAQEGQLPPQVQEMMQQGQQMIQGLQQKLAEMEQDRSLDQAKVGIEEEKVSIERFKAETDRLKALSDMKAQEEKNDNDRAKIQADLIKKAGDMTPAYPSI